MRKLFLCASALMLMTACDKPGIETAGSEDQLVAAAPVVENTENYAPNAVAPARRVAETPVSTFAVDVDTASYANARRMLRQGQLPPPDAVRTEELLNYFRYDYPLPADRSQPFSITTDVSKTPWNLNSRILRIGLRAYDVAHSERPPANLVFLIDVSGSMNDDDKLPLVKHALDLLADRMRHDDKVSIVVYAGAAGLVLPATSNPNEVRSALARLEAGGSTAGGEGLQLAYAVAKDNFIEGGINRVILATDGDFNVGVSDVASVEALVEKNRDSGITLTTLGFGQGNYNDAMMEKIADVGNGNYAYIDQPEEARKVLDDELSSTLVTVAKDVKIQVEFNPAQVSQYRLIGYENRALKEDDFDNDHVDAGDIGAGHQVTAIYEIVPVGTKGWLPDRHFDANKPAAMTSSGDDAVYLKLRYKLPDGKDSRLIEKSVPLSVIRTATAPTGDLAFAESVAAYGQILRHDAYMSDFGMADVRALAGHPDGYLRNEFVELTRMAESAQPRS
jgi:Ca-activated chloride channel family protein